MIPPPKLPDESRRLEALRRYAVLDTLPEQALDDLTALAARICDAPIALISLVDEHRQWFKSRIGTEVTETPRETSFCGHALCQAGLFVVPDATQDQRFADNPVVTSKEGLRFYAGAPLVTPEGATLGTLCVNDRVPRALTPEQGQALLILARQVMTHLELRRQTLELRASEERLRIVTDNAHVGLVIVDRERRYVYANDTYAHILGLDVPELVGERVADVLAPVYEEQIRPRLDRAFAGERVDYELRKPMADGDHYYAARYKPAEDGGTPSLVVVIITDVTAMKRVDAELERQYAEVQTILDAVPALVFYKDCEGRFQRVNRALTEISGVSAEDFVGKTDMETGSPDSEQFRAADLQVITTGEPIHHLEEELHTAAGVRWLLTDKIAHRDARGRIDGVIGFSMDITERKQAEAALREAVRFSQATIDALAAHVCVLDETGAILAANAAWRRFTEVNVAPVHGGGPGENYLRICDGVTGPEAADAAAFAAGIRAVLCGESAEFSMEYPCHSPTEKRWFIGRVTPFAGPGPVRAVVLHANITQRRQTEERFRRLVESNVQGVMFANARGEITDANDAFLLCIGYTREDLQAGLVNWGKLTPPEYADSDRRALEELRLRRTCTPYEKEYIRKDGSRVPILIGAAALEDSPEDGVCFVLDLTERKRLEQQFLRAQRMESLGTLAGGLAHDLNNVFGPILTSLNLLHARFTDPDSQELLTTLRNSTEHGADLIRQVMSFARGMEGRRVPVHMYQILAEIERIANDTFLKRNPVRMDVALDLWRVLGDPTQVRQVLLNLCVNAHDAMPDGGAMSMTAGNLTVDEHYAGLDADAQPGSYVCIQVEDNGVGMVPDVMNKIFEPFFTTKEIGKGTGLGLTTSLAIVKSHGGFMRVSSAVGKGSKFSIFLPAYRDAPAEAVIRRAELPRGNGELILVVDDEVSAQTITRRTLEFFGYRVLLAGNGAEASVIYSQRRDAIAAVIMDMMMPVLDGPSTIRVLRKLKPDVRIIGASGVADTDHVAQATRLGIKHFLPKPFPAEVLLVALREILSD